MHMKHLSRVPIIVASSKSIFSGNTIFIWENDWQAGSRDTGIWQTASRKWTKWDCHFQENTWTLALILFIFGRTAWEILFPHTGIEPRPPVSEAQGPNHWEFANAKIQVFDQIPEFWKTLWTDSFWWLKGSSDERTNKEKQKQQNKMLASERWKELSTPQLTNCPRALLQNSKQVKGLVTVQKRPRVKHGWEELTGTQSRTPHFLWPSPHGHSLGFSIISNTTSKTVPESY